MTVNDYKNSSGYFSYILEKEGVEYTTLFIAINHQLEADAILCVILDDTKNYPTKKDWAFKVSENINPFLPNPNLSTKDVNTINKPVRDMFDGSQCIYIASIKGFSVPEDDSFELWKRLEN